MSTHAADSGTTVLDELARLDKIINSMNHALLIAERLKELSRWKPQWNAELEANKKTLAAAQRERDWLDRAISRQSSA